MKNEASSRLILASGSAARQAMMRQAGLSFGVIPAKIDEYSIMDQNAALGPAEKSLLLAREKALAVSRENADALVIGSDQILCLGERIINKAKTPEDAIEKLRGLRGKTHRLISGVAAAQGGKVLWSHAEHADLTMRDFDEDFLAAYAHQAGPALTACVGAYQIEGAGVWLFTRIEGDFFTIMGLPLPALLGYLYEQHGIGP
ncbi:MAG: septum formation protein Maf [Alphaproteobacteria bacterium]|nr:septum formation protein Maf [Alphaproteobacteria bacterium]